MLLHITESRGRSPYRKVWRLAFFGFYPVREHKLTIKGEPHAVYDLMGKDATLFHHAASLMYCPTNNRVDSVQRGWEHYGWSLWWGGRALHVRRWVTARRRVKRTK